MENELKNSIEFLNYKVGKQHGFATPENYFDALESDIISKKTTETVPDTNGFSMPTNYFNELENDLIERISEISLPKKTNIGGVPEGYFDSLEDSILGKIKEEQIEESKQEVKVISLSQRIRKYIPVAAAASVLLFIATYFFIPSTEPGEVTIAELDEWFENGYGETNSYELAMLFTSDDFSEEEDLSVNVSDDTIEEYFNTIDTSTLIEFEEE
ncbi:hypothetical protein [Tenacibaculum sp. 190524A05c]|uniref:Uncharacterized protein n=1 Tax=Tenacibaculum platacis TaxID=3137852 RepID=A0ABM9P5V3_9FLAO